MSFFSVHGYYGDEFIMESAIFNTKQEATNLCDLLNSSNISHDIFYYIVESKMLNENDNENDYENAYEYEIACEYADADENDNINDNNDNENESLYTHIEHLEIENTSKNTNNHIFFEDGYDLVTDCYLDYNDGLPSSDTVSNYDYLEHIVIKRYGVGFVFDCEQEDIEEFVNNNDHLSIYYLRHCDRYFFRKNELENILNVYHFEVSGEKIPYPEKLFSSKHLTINFKSNQVTCSKKYKYRHDYYFLGGFSNGNNTWTFKPKAFKKFLKKNTLLVQ